MDQPSPMPSAFPIRGVVPLFRASWETYKKNLKPIILFQIIVFLATIGVALLFGLLFTGGLMGLFGSAFQNGGGGFAGVLIGFAFLVFFVVMVLVSGWVGAAQGIFYLDLAQGKPGAIGRVLSEGFHRLFGFLWVSILVSVITLIGFILLIFPGVLWGLRYFFAPFVYLSEGVHGRAALQRSKEITSGIRWTLLARLYVIVIVAGLIGVLQLIPIVGPFILAPLLITPLLALLSWYLFREFQSAKQANPALTSPYGKGKKVALLLPIIIVPLLLASIIGALVITTGKGISSGEYRKYLDEDDSFVEFNGEIGPSDLPYDPFEEDVTSP